MYDRIVRLTGNVREEDATHPPVSGEAGFALLFDGSGHVSVPGVSIATTVSGFSVEAWVKAPGGLTGSSSIVATAGERATHQRRAYGVAMPAREAIERQILGKIGASQRLPGLPASFLGLQALTGELDALPHGSVFNNQEGRIASFFNETEVAPALGQPRDGAGGALVGGLHAEMEKRLGM